MRRLHFVGLVWALLLLAACDDPSNVGLGLVEEQGQPEVRTYEPAYFETTPLQDPTGGASRVLAGQVDDPLLGSLTATGYVDFQSEYDEDDNPAFTGATLRLSNDYVYGDTTASVSLRLYDLIEDWEATGAPADTTLPLGAEILTFTFAPTDTIVTIDLPDEWITTNDAVLRSEDFEEQFHGFALETTSAASVVGFQTGFSSMQVFTEQDTINYPLTRAISGLQRAGEPALPDENLLLVQDGLGPTIQFDFPFEEAELEETPINGAFIRLFADTTALAATPSHFVRPLLQRLQLIAVEEDESIFLLAEAQLNDEGQYVFQAPPTADVLSFRDLLQRVVFGRFTYARFELRFPLSNNTINPMLLYDDAVELRAPQAVLTVSPPGQ